ncbi:DUF1573 domain-containing protein [Candidatus Sumerlaeota bacterium]|nr:DUF1573 domain-containing protein [Candidatus Sumerlaeota bacterium]
MIASGRLCVISLIPLLFSLSLPPLAHCDEYELEVGSDALVDLGSVWTGEEVEVNLILHNPGDEDFVIDRIASTCGCTVPQADLRRIAAGGSEPLQVLFSAPRNRMIRRSVISLHSPAAGAVWEIQMVANVETATRFSPPQLHFGVIPLSASAQRHSREIEMENLTGAPMRVVGLHATPECFVVETGPAVIGPNETLDIAVDFVEPGVVGIHSGTLTVETESPPLPGLVIGLTAEIEGRVEIEPPRVWLGAVSASESKTETIRIRTPENVGFEVTDARSDHPAIAAAIERESEGTYAVHVHFSAASAETGVLNETLRIETNDSLQPEFDVEVLGIVRPN